MLTELSFAINGVPQQITREDNKHKVIFNLKSLKTLKNGYKMQLTLKYERYR
jgi:hypothetical protein